MLKFDFMGKYYRKSTVSRLMLKLIILIGLFLPLSGCQLLSFIRTSPEVDVPSGSILMMEDFSSQEHNWRTWTQDNSRVAYQAGTLRFYVAQPNMDFWSRPGYDFSDVRIEVDAIKVGGPDNNAFGVICRMIDAENFYAFLISSDGYAGILKVVDGNYNLLNSENMEFSPAIVQGEALNHITATCNGNLLELFVNDIEVFSIEDNNFSNGDVGLIAGTYIQAGVDVVFDDFFVYQP